MKLKERNNNTCKTKDRQGTKQACITETKAHIETCQHENIHNIQMTYPYIKTMKIQNTTQTTLLLLFLLPLSISPFGNKAPKRKAKLVLGWRRRGPRARSGGEALGGGG